MNFLRKFLIDIGLACPHKWRPALTITEPEFYAYFGRIPK